LQDLHLFFKDHSTFIWNGTRISGVVALRDFFQRLPSSKIQVDSYDCQPIKGTGS